MDKCGFARKHFMSGKYRGGPGAGGSGWGLGGPAGGYNLFWIVDVGRKTAATSCSCED